MFTATVVFIGEGVGDGAHQAATLENQVVARIVTGVVGNAAGGSE